MSHPISNSTQASGYQNFSLGNNNQSINNPKLGGIKVAIEEVVQKTFGLTFDDNANVYSFIQSQYAFKDSIIVENKLGQGYQGIVSKGYIKQDDCINQAVAIKTKRNTDSIKNLPEQQTMNHSMRETVDEIKALLKLRNSENIVKIISVFEKKINGSDFKFEVHLVMELADISLKYYKEQSYSNPTVVNKNNINFMMHQCLSGVIACNEHRIYNYDIHDGNFLIFFSQKKIKLCDFGILHTYKPQKSSDLMSTSAIDVVITFINFAPDFKNFKYCLRSVTNNIAKRYAIPLKQAYDHPSYLIKAKKEIARRLNDNQELAEILVTSEKYCTDNKDTCLANKIISDIEEKTTCVPLTPLTPLTQLTSLKKAKKHENCVVS